MSLVSLAVRTCLLRALRGATWAGDRVLDSPFEPLADLLRPDAPATPLVAIYTSEILEAPTGKSLTAQVQKIEVCVQIYTPLAVQVQNLSIKEAGLALALEMMDRQVRGALSTNRSVWSDLFGRMVVKYSKLTSVPLLLETEMNLRVPCREITFHCDAIADPEWGRPISGVWLDLDAALRASADLAPFADVIKSLIESPTGLTDWQITAAALGLTKFEIANLGVSPLDGGATDGGAILQGINIAPAEVSIGRPVLP